MENEDRPDAMSEEELLKEPGESDEDFEARIRLAKAKEEVPLVPEEEEMNYPESDKD